MEMDEGEDGRDGVGARSRSWGVLHLNLRDLGNDRGYRVPNEGIEALRQKADPSLRSG
jgi:hypothetical protein